MDQATMTRFHVRAFETIRRDPLSRVEQIERRMELLDPVRWSNDADLIRVLRCDMKMLLRVAKAASAGNDLEVLEALALLDLDL